MRKGRTENTSPLPRNACKKQAGCLDALRISGSSKCDIASISGATSTSCQNNIATSRKVPRSPVPNIKVIKTFQGLEAEGKGWLQQTEARGKHQDELTRAARDAVHTQAAPGWAGTHLVACRWLHSHPRGW